MKKLLVTLLIASTFLSLPNATIAHTLVNSADLERGSSQYFSRADTASLSITGDMAGECWINVESVNEQFILAKQASGSARSYYYRISSNGTILAIVNQAADGSDRSISTGTTDFNSHIGEWVHTGFSFNSSNGEITIFVDAVDDTASMDDTSATAINDSNSATEIGAVDGGTQTFDGKQSLCRVWSEQRTATQFNDNKCTVLGATANLEAEWTLDNTLLDNSGNGNTVTNNNSVPFVADVPAECEDVVTAAQPHNAFFYVKDGELRVKDGELRVKSE